jgi:hypothetical protein
MGFIGNRVLRIVVSVCCVCLLAAVAGAAEPLKKSEGVIVHLLKFSEGVAGIYIKGKWGFVDAAGKMLIEPLFHEVRHYHEGYAPVKLDKKWGLIDKKGRYVVNPRFDEGMGEFSQGLVAVKKGGSWGFIDSKGQSIIAPQFDEVKEFKEGKAAVRIKDKWGFIDKKGRFIINPRFSDVGVFSGNLAPARIDKDWGYIRDNGEWKIDPQFDAALSFSEGLATVQDDSKWGVITQDGKFVVNPQFDEGRSFSRKLAAFKKAGAWGYLNRQGAFAIAPTYAMASDFSAEGLALVEQYGEQFYIDTENNRMKELPTAEGKLTATGKLKALRDIGGCYPAYDPSQDNLGDYCSNPFNTRWIYTPTTMATPKSVDVIFINLSMDDLLVDQNSTNSSALLPPGNRIPAGSTWVATGLGGNVGGRWCWHFEPTGACCSQTQGCAVMTAASCKALPGGVYNGDYTTCGSVNNCVGGCSYFPDPKQPSHTPICSLLSSSDCYAKQGHSPQGKGIWYGVGTTTCAWPTGACTVCDGYNMGFCASYSCSAQTPDDCAAKNGSFSGIGSKCGSSSQAAAPKQVGTVPKSMDQGGCFSNLGISGVTLDKNNSPYTFDKKLLGPPEAQRWANNGDSPSYDNSQSDSHVVTLFNTNKEKIYILFGDTSPPPGTRIYTPTYHFNAKCATY